LTLTQKSDGKWYELARMDISGSTGTGGAGAGWVHDGTKVFTGLPGSGYRDLDLSAFVVGEALVMLRVINTATATVDYDFKADGISDEGQGEGAAGLNNLAASRTGYVVLETASNSIIEWRTGSNQATDIFLEGYIASSTAIQLGTNTAGDYVATLTDSGSSTFVILNSGTENASVTISLNQDSIDDEHINWGTSTGQVSAADIPMDALSGASFTTLQQMQNVFHSAGWLTGGNITDDGDGTITVALGEGLIRETNDDTAPMFFTHWPAESGANVNLTDNDINWVYVEYNSGSPRVIATNTERTDFHTNILLGLVQASGTTLHLNTVDKHTVGDHASRMIRRLKDTMAFSQVTGGIISATGTLNFQVTAGDFWQGLTEFSTNAFDSGSGTFNYWHIASPTGFTQIAAQQAIDATQYDDGDGILGVLSNNKYGVHWVYMEVDSDIDVLYGRGDYTLSEAEDAQPPASVPEPITTHGFLIGKIIIKKSDSAFTQIESTFQTTFTGSIAQDHGNLAGLTDDDHTQYLLADGSRALAGAWDMASQTLTNVNITSGSWTGGAITLGSYTGGAYVYTLEDSGSSTFNISGLGGETAIGTIELNQDSVDDEHINWGAGVGPVDIADVPGGTAGVYTWDFSLGTMTVPSRLANHEKHFKFNLFNPNSIFDTDTQVCFEMNLIASITVTRVEITCDADPATELNIDLKFATEFIGLGSSTLIAAIDTTNGTTDISTFNVANIPQGMDLYIEFGADPIAAIKQALVKITWDYD